MLYVPLVTMTCFPISWKVKDEHSESILGSLQRGPPHPPSGNTTWEEVGILVNICTSPNIA